MEVFKVVCWKETCLGSHCLSPFAPSLGFLGTVIGMVQAFDDIQKAGDISPTIVAAGMKVALITTVFGLIVAIILQVFYNYILNKLEGILNKMEDASITFLDQVIKYNVKYKNFDKSWL